MKLRNYVLTFIFLFTLYLIVSDVLNNNASSNTGGAPAVHTGSPGDGNVTCTSCHAGPLPVVQTGWITSNIPASGYVPGSTYAITATATRSGHTKFGFEISPLNIGGTLLGSMVLTNTETQLVGSSKYITHTATGTSGSGSKTWSFNWTAPSTGTGNVIFYGAFNVTNNNNGSSGDTIYKSTLSVSECTVATQPGSISGNTTVCSGSSQVYSVATVAGATGYNWTLPSGWTGNSTTNSITTTAGSSSGTISVSVINNCGNRMARTIAVSIDQLSVSSTQSNVTCNNGNNGSATAIPVNGNTPYQYSWIPSGGSSATASNLFAGTYSVTVTDTTGCSASTSVNITEPLTPLSVSTTQTNVKCRGASTGTATATVSGGTPSYSYSWTPSVSTLPIASSISAGNYSVLITDANGCIASASVNITQPATAIGFSSVHTDVNCFGDSTGTATVTVTGGTPAYSYSWSPSGGNNSTASNLTSGVYIVTITDSNSCTDSSISVISQPENPIILTIVQSNNVDCNGNSTGSATVFSFGGTGSYTYHWSPSGGNSATASNLSAGTFTVTVIDSLSCSASKSVVITQPPPLSLTMSHSNINCFGASTGNASVAVSGGTSGYRYSWSLSGGNSAIAINLSSAIYSVTVTDANNCIASNSVTIFQPSSALSLASTHTDVSCNGGLNGTASVAASGGTPGYLYSWSPAGGNSTIAANLAAGTYIVTVTDANNCSSTSSSIITQPSPITVTTSSTNSNCSQTDGTVSIVASGGFPGYTYSWNTSPVQTTPTAINLAAGTYTVIVSDLNGCEKNFIVPLNDNSSLAVTLDSVTNVSCFHSNNGSATISVSGGLQGYSYSWFPSGGDSATAINLYAGNYFASVTDAAGCILALQVSITQPDSLVANAGPDLAICRGESIVIGGLPVSIGGTPPYLYAWSPTTNLSSSTDSLPSANPDSTTIYSITINDHNGCSSASSIKLTIYPLPQNPVITQNADTLHSIVATSYQWYLNNNILLNDTGEAYIPLQEGDYTIEITDSNGCSAISSPYHFAGVGINVITTGSVFKIYPNPFQHQTTIVYSMGKTSYVTIEVCQFTGIKIATLISKKQDAGIYQLPFNTDEKTYPEGIYLLRLYINNEPIRQILFEII